MKILNIGSGNKINKKADNLDYINGKGINIVHDLNKFPYPINDKTYDIITAYQILDHLDSMRKTFIELHRILKKGGHIIFTVPHFSSREASHPDHNCTCSTGIVNYLCLREFKFNTANDSLDLYKRISIKIKLYHGRHYFSGIIENIINKHQVLYESTFLNSMFPAHEIKFILQKK